MKDRLYTTQLQAGLGVINEIRTLLSLWMPGMKGPDLYRESLDSGQFPNVSARRLQNLVTECFAPRLLNKEDYPANVLKKLSPSLTVPEFNQLLFLFTARANVILADFVSDVYWPRYSSGHNAVGNDEAKEFVLQANRNGRTKIFWSESTIQRIARYLTGCCADFGLLESGRRSKRRFNPFRIEQTVMTVLVYDLHFSGLGDNAVIAHPDWELFGLQQGDVLDELKRLSLRGHFIIQSAGGVTRISWKYKRWEELIHVFTER